MSLERFDPFEKQEVDEGELGDNDKIINKVGNLNEGLGEQESAEKVEKEQFEKITQEKKLDKEVRDKKEEEFEANDHPTKIELEEMIKKVYENVEYDGIVQRDDGGGNDQ